MELKFFIRQINENELVLETEAGAKALIPKLMLPDAKIDQVLYLSVNLEPDKAAREVLNELLLSHD